MRITSLIIFILSLSSCLYLSKKSELKNETTDSPEETVASSGGRYVSPDGEFVSEGLFVSDGLKKEKIGPFRVLIPKGWCFNKARWGNQRFALEMSPSPCSRNIEEFSKSKYGLLFTYSKEKKETELIEFEKNPFLKKQKNAVFNSFQMGQLKGESVHFQGDDQDRSVLSFRLDNSETLHIWLSAPKGKLSKMEQALQTMNASFKKISIFQ